MEVKSKEEQFIILLSEHQRRIYSFILVAVGRQIVAEEIMQQTCLVMWRSFSRYENGTNFAAWGREIAKYEIFNYRKKKARELFLDQDSLNKVIEMSQQVEISSDQRVKALEGCLKKLTDKKRVMVQYRYHEGLTCSHIAEKMQLPLPTVYKTLARIHVSLQDCIRRTLLLWDAEI